MALPSSIQGMDGILNSICLVTGGSGYLGQRICVALLKAGAKEVRTLDVAAFSGDTEAEPLLRRVRRVRGDVRSSADVCSAMAGCDTVFHTASYGMSGREMLNAARTRDVNLNGTATLLAAASTLGVRRFVFTSSYNTVFGGQRIVNGDETLPLYPPSLHWDEYSRTKALAERAVLTANAPALATCAVRAAAIYGPGETRHFPRIARLVSLGAVVFSVGPPSTRVDWVHGDDLARAHVLAAAALKPGSPACGAAYFINDGQPVNQTTFLLPLIHALGGRTPRLWVPVWMMLPIAYFVQCFCLLVWRLTRGRYIPSPLLLPAEVLKVGVTHTFSIDKARRELGYEPQIKQADGLRDTVAALLASRQAEADEAKRKKQR